MKKLILGLTVLLAMVAFTTSSLVAEDSKCGEGKCNTEKPAKCGTEKPKPESKCGEGKCGGK